MNEENSKRTTLNETWRIAVKLIAPDHAVDADELLLKLPDLFTADDLNQQQTDACIREFVQIEKMTVAECIVCICASQIAVRLGQGDDRNKTIEFYRSGLEGESAAIFTRADENVVTRNLE